MYPPQTSLIPAAVALTRYIAEHGFSGNYPYWYLGTTPVRYLTGPVVPNILIVLKNLFSFPNYFVSVYCLLFIVWFLSVLGWFLLIKTMSKNTKVALLASMLLVVLPWRYFNTLVLADLPFTVSRSLLPFVLLIFYKTKKENKLWFWVSVALCSVLLLIDTTIIPDVLIGLFAIAFFKAFNPKLSKFQKTTVYIRRSIKVVVLSIIISIVWYTPGYWLTILFNPSTGGVTGAGAILRVLDLGKATLPVVAALATVYLSHRFKSRLSVFISVWFFAFGFLTFFRFISDYDFWQDWSTWIYQLEIGAALFVACLFGRKSYFVIQVCTLLAFVVLTVIFYNHFDKLPLISKVPPGYVTTLDKLDELTGGSELVFISGSSVWWANALFDVKQVRGGVDRVSVNPVWSRAAWVFRESQDLELNTTNLKDLGVKYVLVHADDSQEYFQDFKYVSKWEALGKSVWSDNGDIIYSISD